MAELKNSGDLNAMEISQIFKDYVTRMQDKERHTRAALKEVDAFDTYCASEFPNNVRLQVALFDRMMNCAVEYELSGFIAGFQTAASLLSGEELQVQNPIMIPEAEKYEKAADTEKTVEEVSASANETEQFLFHSDTPELDFITSRTIANLFETTNWKVVRRIEQKVLPYCSEQQKAGFVKYYEMNFRNRKMETYKLDHNACEVYFRHMEPYKNNIRIAAGLGKLEELMNNVFRKPEDEKRIAFCL